MGTAWRQRASAARTQLRIEPRPRGGGFPRASGRHKEKSTARAGRPREQSPQAAPRTRTGEAGALDGRRAQHRSGRGSWGRRAEAREDSVWSPPLFSAWRRAGTAPGRGGTSVARMVFSSISVRCCRAMSPSTRAETLPPGVASNVLGVGLDLGGGGGKELWQSGGRSGGCRAR